MKKAAVTFITGEKQALYPPVMDFADVDFICFSDFHIKSLYWEIRPLNGLSIDEIKNNKEQYLKEYETVLFISPQDVITADDNRNIRVMPLPQPDECTDMRYYGEVKHITEKYAQMNKEQGSFTKQPAADGRYGGYPLKLSIGVLVGKKSPDFDKCLDGIKMILAGVKDSELIVVDTGNEDGSVKKAQEFGARVIPFTWICDFAAARNAAVKAASGSWFMSIDDDEWFDNADAIIDFFRDDGGLYEKYDYAVYTVRNYLDENGKTYEDAGIVRLARMRPDLRYVKRIHENFNFPEASAINPYAINATAHHYGYVRGLNNRAEKSKRNLALLLISMEEEPEDWHTLVQIIQELHADNRYDLAYPFVLRGLSLEREKEGFHKSLFVVALVKTLIELERKEIWRYEQQICDADLNYIEAAYVSYWLSVCAYEQGAQSNDRRLFDKALRYGEGFEQSYFKYINSAREMQILQSATICENLCRNAGYYTDLLIIRALIYGARKDTKKAKEALRRIKPANLHNYAFEYYAELIRQNMATTEFLQSSKATEGSWVLLIQALYMNPGLCLELIESLTTSECDVILGRVHSYADNNNIAALGELAEGLMVLRLVYEYLESNQLSMAVNALKLVISRQDNIGVAAGILLEKIKSVIG